MGRSEDMKSYFSLKIGEFSPIITKDSPLNQMIDLTGSTISIKFL